MDCQIFKLFGLPDTSVKESKERVKTAIRNSNIQLLSKRNKAKIMLQNGVGIEETMKYTGLKETQVVAINRIVLREKQHRGQSYKEGNVDGDGPEI